MATYAIGDVQGCFSALLQLLEKIQFDSSKDTLWFTGDLINRGKESLATLRFVKQLGPKHHTVLGNHDLHFLAVAYGVKSLKKEDTLSDILSAPDREELIDWLLHRPLLHHDTHLNFTMVHAGFAPSWDLPLAKKLADEIATILQGSEVKEFFLHMYGNLPDFWDDRLRGWERARCIINFFTRVRFCYPDGRIELQTKNLREKTGLIPWFEIPNRSHADLKIIFGHWAALEGKTSSAFLFALDTGCVWGNCLTAMRLEDEKRFNVKCL